MLLAPAELPATFTAQDATVQQLTEGNAALLAAAEQAEVAPRECRPTADADMNRRMSEDDAAVLAARSPEASLTNVVFAGARDVDADLRENTDACATTRTTVAQGSRAGAVITAEHRKLAAPVLAGQGAGRLGLVGRLSITQMLVLRTDTTTTMPDGATSRSASFAGYAVGQTPAAKDKKADFTVALTVVGASTPFTTPFPELTPPMSDKEFAELFSKALVAAGRA